jgi:AbrB family looped-hinge helix DNA binding protein
MHPVDKLTRRFQVTIPREIRKLLRLDAGPRLVLIKHDGTVVVTRDTITVEI